MSNFKVTKKAMRPVSLLRECFYCGVKVGGIHKEDCILIKRKARIQMNISFEQGFPAHWDRTDIESHFNDSSWCVDNILATLEDLSKKSGCLCTTDVGFICKDISEVEYLDE